LCPVTKTFIRYPPVLCLVCLYFNVRSVEISDPGR